MARKNSQLFMPQLATLSDHAPEGDDWIHETKFDGYRILCYIKPKSVHLITRNGNDWTSKFPEIALTLNTFPIKNTILDGEMVVLNKKGLSKFQLLQNALDNDATHPISFFIFDIPFYNGKSIRHYSCLQRKELLQKSFNSWKTKHHNVLLTHYISGHGTKIHKKACRSGLEGIVSKNIHSPYEQRRNKNWLKVKCIHQQEFIIAGYTHPQRSRKYFGALLLGYYDKNKSLVYCGKVGTGFSFKTLSDLYQKFKKIQTDKCPFTLDKNKMTGIKNIQWVKPRLVAQLSFTEWTQEGRLRHPSFLGLRSDKKTRDITKEG